MSAFRPFFAAVLLASILAGCHSLEPRQADPAEVRELTVVMDLTAGKTFADVGAGRGEWALALAEAVAPGGTVLATEVDQERLDEIRQRFAAAGLRRARAVLGDDTSTGLDAGCCDALLLRRVYHHFVAPRAMNRSLFEALKPGGLLAVVDYSTYDGSPIEGVPADRESHSVRPDIVEKEALAAGFEVVAHHSPWNGRDDMYCLILRRPAN
ncbi:MAG: methyltransferase domain-containing protein [Acidobacteriota bacterium]